MVGKYFSFLLICLHLGVAIAADLPSAQLSGIMERNPAKYSQWATDVTSREKLFKSAILSVSESTPVDNRPYLLALAVDLYNSLPAGQDPEGWNDGEIPGKGMMWRYLRRAAYREEVDARNAWDSYMSYKSAIGKEVSYLERYMLSNVKIDAFGQAASLDPAKLDLQNPTHYAGMRRWMSEQATAMTNSVPPWEAVTWTTQHCAEWKGCDNLSDWSQPVTTTSMVAATASATHESGPTIAPDATQEVTVPQDTVPTASLDESPVRPMWLWLILALAAVVGVGWVVKSPGSKGH